MVSTVQGQHARCASAVCKNATYQRLRFKNSCFRSSQDLHRCADWQVLRVHKCWQLASLRRAHHACFLLRSRTCCLEACILASNMSTRFLTSKDCDHRADMQVPRVHKRWQLASLREAHHARFLLRPSALELFMADRSTALLNFPSAKVGTVAVCLCILAGLMSHVHFLLRPSALDCSWQTARLPCSTSPRPRYQPPRYHQGKVC